MKAHKVTLLVIGFDDIEGDEVKTILENANYPNDCINPHVMSVETSDIGEWSDEHPLNKTDQIRSEFEKLFNR